MDLGEIALLVTALGIGSILTRLVDQLLDRRKGRQAAEQSAWEQRDREASRRRRLQEVLHETRTSWHQETGKRFEDMPPWPDTPKKT